MATAFALPRVVALRRSLCIRQERQLRRCFCTAAPDGVTEVKDVEPPKAGPEEFYKVDLRVGIVRKVYEHPDADTLFVEEIDVGEEEPRTICSGLRNYLSQQDIEDAKVVVVANLKARNMRGIKSHGMVLCASNKGEGKVELLKVPDSAEAGERIVLSSLAEESPVPEPASANALQKKKVFEAVQPNLKTNSLREATFGDDILMVRGEAVTAANLADAAIS